MNINRNNYEEYFLLYADNELTATEKRVVEIFLQENVDLKEEFLMIQMTVNTPEKEIGLFDKSFLLKKEPPFINGDNYEEIFVLYHDGQLSKEQAIETEKFVTANSNVQLDFDLIGKAKLIPETSIVYPGKKELYRKENSGKIIPLVFWRSLAAAVFIGFGIWVGVSYFNKNDLSQPVAKATNKIENSVIKESKPGQIIPIKKPVAEEKTVASSMKIKENTRTQKVKTGNKHPFSDEGKTNEEQVAKTGKVPVIEQKIKDVNSADNYQLATTDEPIHAIPEKLVSTENAVGDHAEISPVGEIDQDHSKPNYARTASYISDADRKNDNYVFYDVSTEEFRKTKIGGFLKKVRRIVERTNPVARLLGEEGQMAAK